MVFRKVFKLDKQIIELTLPSNFIGKLVEIIAFTIPEIECKSQKQGLFKKLTVVHVDNSGYKFNRDELYEN